MIAMKKIILNDDEYINLDNSFDRFKPKEIVRELDNYIIGQNKAKKMIAIALRNRIRRRFVKDEFKNEIYPKNILMIGPTGVGKTEIARRMAQIIDAPFIKVEATKFTERGYVGRDVEYMVRALVNHAVNTVKSRMRENKKEMAEDYANEIILPILKEKIIAEREAKKGPLERKEKTYIRDEVRRDYYNNKYDDYEIEISINKSKQLPIPFGDMLFSMDDIDSIQNFFYEEAKEAKQKKRVKVKEAKEILFQQYLEEHIDKDKAVELGLKWAQEFGIIFIDEIDKIADRSKIGGPDVSREGVQRDLLPIVEGTSVTTKFGVVNTDHILFIAAGAFHVSKPSDLIPELQGRFPIRVELEPLDSETLLRILKEPKNSLIKQYQALLETEGVDLSFTDDALVEIVNVAREVNENVENIGARRLHTIMEYLLEDISFNAPEMKGKKVIIDRDYVIKNLKDISKNIDLTKYIL